MMMENIVFNFDLIHSTYHAEEANVVLMRLVDDKINFLKQTIFGLQIRFGKDTSHLERRVEELSEQKVKLKEFFSKMESEGNQIEIHCPVSIKIKSNTDVQLLNTSVEA